LTLQHPVPHYFPQLDNYSLSPALTGGAFSFARQPGEPVSDGGVTPFN
jgi:hypothetical protein